MTAQPPDEGEEQLCVPGSTHNVEWLPSAKKHAPIRSPGACLEHPVMAFARLENVEK